MAIRAILYDLARSQRANETALKRAINNTAACGLNMLLLYLEHRFDFPSCPGIAPPGSLTPTLAGELVQYGQAHGVQVVPMVNVLGHCEGITATQRYAHLAVDPFEQSPWGGYEQLNFELPEARELAAAMLRDVCAAFPGEWLSLGGDEVRRMPYLFPDDPDRQVQALVEHMNILVEMGQATGRRLMLAGDVPRHYPQVLAALPRDVALLDWYYGPGPIDLRELRDAGFPVLATATADGHSGFGMRGSNTAKNLALMIGQARDIGLPGFVVTTWEKGCGTSTDLCWPWVALAGRLADGPVADAAGCVADFAAKRYGIDGAAFLRLHTILDQEIDEVIASGGAATALMVRLRKSLFRSADPFTAAARPMRVPVNKHQMVWEPSPFHAWLLLRPILSDAMMKRLDALMAEAVTLRGQLAATATGADAVELTPLLGMAETLGILVERLRLLQQGQADYHQAALAQQTDPATFDQALARTIAALEQLRPGIARLRAIVQQLDDASGLDVGEHHWLAVHEQSLDEHIEALRRRRSTDDALLEFGEFLRRPANITQRLTWR